MFLAIVVFLLRNDHYYEPQTTSDETSTISVFFAITWYAIRNCSRRRDLEEHVNEQMMEVTNQTMDGHTSPLTSGHVLNHSNSSHRRDPSLGDNVIDDQRAQPSAYTVLHGAHSEDFHWLDVAKLRYEGRYDNELVEEVCHFEGGENVVSDCVHGGLCVCVFAIPL